MRWLSFSLLLAFAPVAAAAPLPPDPESECRAAVEFLEAAAEEDRPYLRFGSTYAIDPAERTEFHRFLRIWWRQLTLNPNRRNLPAPVPGSSTLFWFDLRSFDWNIDAWRAVARRDRTFREPWVSHETAERLRLLVGEVQEKPDFPVLVVVDLFGLFRRTYQTVETADYYDLLFARHRFVLQKETEVRDVLVERQGKWVREPTPFYRRKFVDFPKDRTEWLTGVTGGKVNVKEFEETLTELRVRRGAVARGSEDVARGGSFVARNNREIIVAPLIGKIGAVFAETFDVVKVAGKRDLEENAFTDQKRDRGRVFRDGGELIATLPAGDGIATFLVNDKDVRVEEVPPNIAIHTRDPHDRRVRNGAMACLACHGDAYGFIPISNVIENTSPEEVDVKFKDPKTGKKDRQAAEDYENFFIGWQDDLKPVRETLKGYWNEATASKRGAKDGWTGVTVAEMSLKWKAAYDAPVTIEQAARELGVSVEIARVAASRSVLRRAVDLARKDAVPRTVWDEDVYPALQLILHSKKERVYP